MPLGNIALVTQSIFMRSHYRPVFTICQRACLIGWRSSNLIRVGGPGGFRDHEEGQQNCSGGGITYWTRNVMPTLAGLAMRDTCQ